MYNVKPKLYNNNIKTIKTRPHHLNKIIQLCLLDSQKESKERRHFVLESLYLF